MKKKMIAVIVMGCVVLSCMLNGCGDSTAQSPQKNASVQENESVQENKSGTVQSDRGETVQKASQVEKTEDECSFDDCHFPRVDGSEYCSFHSKHFGRSKKSVHKEDTLTVDDIITQSMIDEIKDAYAAELLAEQEKEEQEKEKQEAAKKNAASEKPKSSGSSSSSHKKPSTGNANHSYKSYDEGYDAIYDDDDYDWNRYQTDRDYANGVDDAMDDWEDEYGEDW